VSDSATPIRKSRPYRRKHNTHSRKSRIIGGLSADFGSLRGAVVTQRLGIWDGSLLVPAASWFKCRPTLPCCAKHWKNGARDQSPDRKPPYRDSATQETVRRPGNSFTWPFDCSEDRIRSGGPDERLRLADGVLDSSDRFSQTSLSRC
jgi:hypothetical protein